MVINGPQFHPRRIEHLSQARRGCHRMPRCGRQRAPRCRDSEPPSRCPRRRREESGRGHGRAVVASCARTPVSRRWSVWRSSASRVPTASRPCARDAIMNDREESGRDQDLLAAILVSTIGPRHRSLLWSRGRVDEIDGPFGAARSVAAGPSSSVAASNSPARVDVAGWARTSTRSPGLLPLARHRTRRGRARAGKTFAV